MPGIATGSSKATTRDCGQSGKRRQNSQTICVSFPSFYIYADFSTLDLCIRHVRVLKYLYMFADQRRSTSVWCLILKGGVYSPWSWRQQPQVVRPEETSSNVRHMIHSLKMDRPIFCVSGSGATASASERAFGEVDGRCCSAQDEGELTASILLSGTVELAVFILVAAFQRNDSSTFVRVDFHRNVANCAHLSALTVSCGLPCH